MRIPLKFKSYKKLKYPEWSEAIWLNDNIILAKDDVNFAFIDIHEDKIIQDFPDLHPYQSNIIAVFVSRNKKFVILVLNTARILIFDLNSFKILQIFESLPTKFREYLLQQKCPKYENENYDMKRIFGVQTPAKNHITNQINQLDIVTVDYILLENTSSLLIVLRSEILLCTNQQWFSYEDIINFSTTSSSIELFYNHTIGSWNIYQFIENAILIHELKALEVKSQVKILQKSDSGALLKVNKDGNILAAGLNHVGLFVIQKDHIKANTNATDLVFTSLDFTFQNNFIIGLSNKGEIFIFTKTADCAQIIFQSIPNQEKLNWTNLCCHFMENLIMVNDGFSVTVFQMPVDLETSESLTDMIITKANLLCHQQLSNKHKGPSNMVLMQENVPIGFNYILQDYHGEIQDYKQALDSYFDAFSLLLDHSSVKEKKRYSREILQGICHCLIQMDDPNYGLILLSKATELICTLDHSTLTLAFSIKLINNSMKILCDQRPNSLELLSHLSKWTMSLQRAHHVPGSWFSPAFKALTHLARDDQDVMNLILQTSQVVESINSKSKNKNLNANPNPNPNANTNVFLYKGQYSKAITQWEELALLGKQPEENLLKVMKTLIDLDCFKELANFISWIFTNFTNQIFDQMIQHMCCELLVLKEKPSVLLKMLLLRGKFLDAIKLCQMLNCPKWILIFDPSQNPMIIDENLIDNLNPCKQIMEEIKSMINEKIPVTLSPHLMSYILNHCRQQVEKFELCQQPQQRSENIPESEMDYYYFKWASLLIRSFGWEDHPLTEQICNYWTFHQLQCDLKKLCIEMTDKLTSSFEPSKIHQEIVDSILKNLITMSQIDPKLWTLKRNNISARILTMHYYSPNGNKDYYDHFYHLYQLSGDVKNSKLLKPFIRDNGQPFLEESNSDIFSFNDIFTTLFENDQETKSFHIHPMKESESLFRKSQNVPIENYKKGLFRNINPTQQVNKQKAAERTNHTTTHQTITGSGLCLKKSPRNLLQIFGNGNRKLK